MKRIAVLLVTLTALFVVPVANGAQPINTPYEFPVQPGTPEWEALQSHVEMEQVCEVPASILSRMTTEALVATALDYPLAYDFILFNNVESGFEIVVSRSNCLLEVMQRPTTGVTLLNSYEAWDPVALPDCAYKRRGSEKVCRFAFMFAELLMVQDEVLQNMTDAQRRRALRVVQEKYLEKRSDRTYGTFQLNTTVRCMRELLMSVDPGNTAITSYPADGLRSDLETMDRFASAVGAFVRQNPEREVDQ